MNSTQLSSDVSGQRTSAVLTRAEVLGFTILDFIFGTIMTVTNGFLFVTICRDPCRCLRTPSAFLIANLSVADFFMGIISYLRAVELLYRYCGWGTLPTVNITQYFLGAVSILAAVLTLIAMSYDRYIAVITPFKYPQKITNARAKVAIAVIWINALFLSVLPASGVRMKHFLLAYCYSHFVIPSIILTAVYAKIYKIVVQNREELKDVRASLRDAERRKQLERENRMVITFILILCIFYCSFTPYFIHIQILYFCSCRNSGTYHLYRYIANEFLSVSSMVDPFMYAWRLPRFSRSLRLCFKQRKNRNAVVPWEGTSFNYKKQIHWSVKDS